MITTEAVHLLPTRNDQQQLRRQTSPHLSISLKTPTTHFTVVETTAIRHTFMRLVHFIE